MELTHSEFYHRVLVINLYTDQEILFGLMNFERSPKKVYRKWEFFLGLGRTLSIEKIPFSPILSLHKENCYYVRFVEFLAELAELCGRKLLFIIYNRSLLNFRPPYDHFLGLEKWTSQFP